MKYTKILMSAGVSVLLGGEAIASEEVEVDGSGGTHMMQADTKIKYVGMSGAEFKNADGVTDITTGYLRITFPTTHNIQAIAPQYTGPIWLNDVNVVIRDTLGTNLTVPNGSKSVRQVAISSTGAIVGTGTKSTSTAGTKTVGGSVTNSELIAAYPDGLPDTERSRNTFTSDGINRINIKCIPYKDSIGRPAGQQYIKRYTNPTWGQRESAGEGEPVSITDVTIDENTKIASGSPDIVDSDPITEITDTNGVSNLTFARPNFSGPIIADVGTTVKVGSSANGYTGTMTINKAGGLELTSNWTLGAGAKIILKK
ncbi:MAG: hypothetical protein EOM76_12005 [Sphingobacteriia bacterium]|nr:hypothetical protein [Sphingobacteriia bacterium]